MGELIQLKDCRDDRSRPTRDTRPAFYFDPGCPLSYLTAEQIERTLGDVEWIPVAAASVHGALSIEALDELRERAERRARALRLPLVWPDRFPAPSPCALRATAFAAEQGAGARFALAASRLAFCGGFDLEDPETLAEAAAAAGISLRACLHAAGDTTRDATLAATAHGLRARQVGELPAFRVGRRWSAGDSALLAAAALRQDRASFARPLAPVG
ncbi:MAG: DsbA family protein [Solirubrobacteraceae bacterium]